VVHQMSAPFVRASSHASTPPTGRAIPRRVPATCRPIRSSRRGFPPRPSRC